MISRARVRMGIRTEKGFVMSGSVHAVEASGVGGVTCLTINPSVLWGGEKGGDGGGKSINHGEGAGLFCWRDQTAAAFSLCFDACGLAWEGHGCG